MLLSVRIQNYKSLREVALTDIGRVVALVGRNGAGKTNVMRAIEEGARLAISSKLLNEQDFSKFLETGATPCSTTYKFSTDGKTYEYSQSLAIRMRPETSKDNKAVRAVTEGEAHEALREYVGGTWKTLIDRRNDKIILPERNRELQVGLTVPCLRALASLLPQDDPLVGTIQHVVKFFTSIHYYPFDEPNNSEPLQPFGIVQHGEYAKWLLEHNRAADPSSSVLMRLIYMSLEAPELLEELKSLLGPDGLGLLKDISVQPLGLGAATQPQKEGANNAFYFVQFSPYDGGSGLWRQYGDISFGTRRILRILASILVDKSSVMLIEQPEDGIHPGLLHKLIPLLATYSENAQFILSSHSPAVFNRLKPEQICLVEMVSGVTELRSLTGDELNSAERFISEDGPLSDFIETVQTGG